MIANCSNCGDKKDSFAQRFQTERYGAGKRVFTEKGKEIRKCTCCGTQGVSTGMASTSEAKK